eukprot:s2267_g6.t1
MTGSATPGDMMTGITDDFISIATSPRWARETKYGHIGLPGTSSLQTCSERRAEKRVDTLKITLVFQQYDHPAWAIEDHGADLLLQGDKGDTKRGVLSSTDATCLLVKFPGNRASEERVCRYIKDSGLSAMQVNSRYIKDSGLSAMQVNSGNFDEQLEGVDDSGNFDEQLEGVEDSDNFDEQLDEEEPELPGMDIPKAGSHIPQPFLPEKGIVKVVECLQGTSCHVLNHWSHESLMSIKMAKDFCSSKDTMPGFS